MDNKSYLERKPVGAEMIATLSKRSKAVSNSLKNGDFWELYNDKDEIHFINPKAKKDSKNLNFYGFTKQDFSSLNQLMNDISVQEIRLMGNEDSFESLKYLNRNVWFDISRKSNAIEGIFEDFDFDLEDFRKQLRGKFLESDPVDPDNFDFIEYFKILREREKNIEKNNDSVILSIRGKKSTHKISLETVRHYIAFKYAERCSKYHQRHEMTASDFLAITDNVACLLSGNDIMPSRNIMVGVNGNVKLANWTPVSEDKIFEKLKALAEWVVGQGCNKSSTKLHPLEQAAIFHAEFTRIHPYLDGNGRTCRIMSNYILMLNDMPTVALRNKHTQEYFKANNKAIESHDIDDLLSIFYEEAMKSAKNIKECLDHIESNTLGLNN